MCFDLNSPSAEKAEKDDEDENTLDDISGDEVSSDDHNVLKIFSDSVKISVRISSRVNKTRRKQKILLALLQG